MKAGASDFIEKPFNDQVLLDAPNQHFSDTTDVVFTPDGRWGLSGSYETLRLWELQTGKCIRTFEGHTGWVESVAISPDGRWVVVGGDGLQCWDARTGQRQ